MYNPERAFETSSSETLLKNLLDVQEEIGEAHCRPALTELYQRAGYILNAIYARSRAVYNRNDYWQSKEIADSIFKSLADNINNRARQLGTRPDYDDIWGEITIDAEPAE